MNKPAWKQKRPNYWVPIPTEEEWRAFLASTEVAACGHKLVDDRHCTHGCGVVDHPLPDDETWRAYLAQVQEDARLKAQKLRQRANEA
jgi:hypothetical protein